MDERLPLYASSSVVFSRGLLADPQEVAKARLTSYRDVFHRLLDEKVNAHGSIMYTLLIAEIAIILAWPVLLCRKLDGTISTSWVVVWTPMWIADAVALFYLATFVSWGNLEAPAGTKEGGWEDPFPLYRRVLDFVKWMLLTLFQAFFMLQLDGTINWPWLAVLSPFITWSLILLFDDLYSLHWIFVHLDERRRHIAIPILVKDLRMLLQPLLIVLKLEGMIEWDWLLVIAPTWFYLAWDRVMACWWKSFNNSVEHPDQVPGGQKLAEIKLEHLKSKVEPMKGPHWLSCVIVWVTVVSLLRGDEVSFIHWAAFVSVTVLFTWPCLGAFMPFDNLRGCLP